jgi:hypothetical protein
MFKNNSKPVKISPFLCFSFQRSSKVFDFSSNNQDGSAEQFLENNSIVDFMKFKRGSDRSSGELQTAAVVYRKRLPWSILYPFFQVLLSQSWLVSIGFDVLVSLLNYLLFAFVHIQFCPCWLIWFLQFTLRIKSMSYFV